MVNFLQHDLMHKSEYFVREKAREVKVLSGVSQVGSWPLEAETSKNLTAQGVLERRVARHYRTEVRNEHSQKAGLVTATVTPGALAQGRESGVGQHLSSATSGACWENLAGIRSYVAQAGPDCASHWG